MAAAPAAAADRRANKHLATASPATSAAFLFFVALVIGVVVSVRWITTAVILTAPTTTTTTATLHLRPQNSTPRHHHPPPPPPPKPKPFSCPVTVRTPSPSRAQIPKQFPTLTLALIVSPNSSCSPPPQPPPPLADTTTSSCPSYFRYIHEDLRPWRAAGGITRAMVERAGATANFRLVVLDGRAYIEQYVPSFQTRDLFTLWGILQLLRRYPGRVPDLDLMFDCVDWPVVRAELYQGSNATLLPPLFRYCGDDETLDIVFPDWSFWGWPEINIKPWNALKEDLKKGNKKVRWMDREPYAYWKGNPTVAVTREELLKCNVSDTQDWNARIYAQDWTKESKAGYKKSDLASQCTHRYKIYIEGSAWSVSEKYILACDSLTLVVTPKYYDFFSRMLMPVQHYWPIRDDNKCSSIKYAVDWGNSHKQKAHRIGKQASKFIQEELKMDYIYDYMLHVLTEYAKLLRYKPTKPPEAIELCAESMFCQAQDREKKFMMDSMVESAHNAGPCELPPPFSPAELRMLQSRKDNSIKQVEMWEQRALNRVDSKR